MTTNEVWAFQKLSNGKLEVVRKPPGDVDPSKLPGASHAVTHDGHTLVVRAATGFAESCRTCGAVGLLKGQLCEMIDKYNDEKHPL